ncbi:hypothetical protein AXG93_3218s1070 [Marchantia polymorpha subsp. ruderalis]|uniref:Phosphoribulokinase/uridine kinase domain-containing protein n=1 Tax=Marchantia polymorpha subsp. ruderalis TaxID=1480154 RepID=A0A176WJB1_MARPO|nr:hypothetical protein AXG93_3218s1070 [Marchantia polymorpha subsp. ruderalis]
MAPLSYVTARPGTYFGFQSGPVAQRSLSRCCCDLAGSFDARRSFGLIVEAKKGSLTRFEPRNYQRRLTGVARCQKLNVVSKEAPPVDLQDFICSGVLAKKVGATPERVAERLDEWYKLGNQLAHFLKFDEDGKLSEDEKIRIYQYYLPVYFWVRDQLTDHRSRFASGAPIPPFVVGISAPQGCGKTTIVESLDYLFNATGSPAAAMSMDDVYLTAEGQDKLAADYAGNSLVEAARNGRGDRADPSKWTEVKGPLELVLFEGWMLGFEPQPEEAVTAVDPELALVNKIMEKYYDAWYQYIDSWIIVQVGDVNWVYDWRLQAEIQMRAKGKGGMTDEEVQDFVSRYIPAYKAYLPSLYKDGPKNSKPEKTLRLDIDQNRNPIG